MSGFAESLGVPPQVLIGLIVVLVVQITLQIAAVISLVKTPAEQVTLGGRKWLWALIIVLGEVPGPLVWFFAGRKSALAMDAAARQDVVERTQAAADTLYGPPEE
jgi:hypothetical protein